MRLLIGLYLFGVLSVQPAYSDTLNRGFAWPIVTDNLDPHNISSDTLFTLASHYLEPLLRMAPDRTLRPGVAERWDISEDSKTVTLYLNKQARWASGEQMTALQAKQSIERALSKDMYSDAQPLLLPIKGARQRLDGDVDYPLGIEVPNKHEIRFQLTGSHPDFLKVLAFPISSPVPIHQIGVNGQYPLVNQLDSSGPYRLVHQEKHEVRFEQNKRYFQENSTPYYTEVNFRFADYKDLIKDFLNSSLDILEYIPGHQVPWLQENMPKKFITVPENNGASYLVAKNGAIGKSDAALRKLLMRSVDTERLNKVMTKGVFSPVSGLIPWEVGKPSATKAPSSDINTYLSEGRLLTEQLGYSADSPLVLCITLRRSTTNETVVNFLRATWSAMHVQLNVDYVDGHELEDSDAECVFAFDGFASRTNSVEEIVLAFVSDSGTFAKWFSGDPELKQLSKQFFNSNQSAERNEMIKALTRNLFDRHLVKPLYKGDLVSLVHSDKVVNYSEMKTNMFIPLSEYLHP